MIWYTLSDILVNHEYNWIPNLNHCEEMQPGSPYALDNQNFVNEYINSVNKDITLSDFDKYCATRLMSLEMAIWCKKNQIYYNKENYYRTADYDKAEFVWEPDRNVDGTYKNYLEQINFKYEYTKYNTIDDTVSLKNVEYLYNEDFYTQNNSRKLYYMCISLYRFLNILKEQFDFYIRKSPISDDKLIAYFMDNGKVTLLRQDINSVEFSTYDYDMLIDKIFKSCKRIQKSL